MALGRPISLTNNVASKIIRLLATNNQTVFTVPGGYRINQIGVFRNGVRLSNNSDFTAQDGSTVTLVNAAQTNDEVLFEIQDDFRVADAIVSAASTQTISGDLTVTGTVYGAIVGVNSGGSGGGGLGTAINYSDDTPTPFSYIDSHVTVTSNLLIDTENAGLTTSYVVSVVPNVEVASGVALTVGTGKTMITDILQIGHHRCQK